MINPAHQLGRLLTRSLAFVLRCDGSKIWHTFDRRLT